MIGKTLRIQVRGVLAVPQAWLAVARNPQGATLANRTGGV